MGKITGFLEFERKTASTSRSKSASSIGTNSFCRCPRTTPATRPRAAWIAAFRTATAPNAMTGAPTGCPVNNQIPDWNDLVYRGHWQEASRNLHSTNNFPEFTGRICPAPCEASCTLNIDDNPVTIKTIECAIVDRAYENGWVKPELATEKTGKKVAVVGSGPAGMACAQQLARAGHDVHVFEKFAKAGGLLRYGIPDFKMEKHHIDRRVAQMEAEGVTFHYGAHVGDERAGRQARRGVRRGRAGGRRREAGATCRSPAATSRASISPWISCRSRTAASAASRRTAASRSSPAASTSSSSAAATPAPTASAPRSARARSSVTKFEIMPEPPEHEDKMLTWPDWPLKLRTSSSHEEGVERDFAVGTVKFSGENGQVKTLHCARVDGKFKPIPGTEFDLKADLVLLAMGFVHPVHEGMIKSLGLALDQRGNVKADVLATKPRNPKVFAAGDMRRGQSLVVWAIREGRQAAHSVDKFLMGSTSLPR